jgi:hypothetical protein
LAAGLSDTKEAPGFVHRLADRFKAAGRLDEVDEIAVFPCR